MSQKIGRILLIVEAVVIALPISALAVIATVVFVNDIRRLIGFSLHDTLAVLSVLCLAAVCSGWRLFIAYFRGGLSSLRKQHLGWWAMIVVGLLILLAALVSRQLPPSPEYSEWWYFRIDFNVFVLAIPILIPLGHLAFERFIRKIDHTNTAPSSG
jgi:hypothetical protein